MTLFVLNLPALVFYFLGLIVSEAITQRFETLLAFHAPLDGTLCILIFFIDGALGSVVSAATDLCSALMQEISDDESFFKASFERECDVVKVHIFILFIMTIMIMIKLFFL